VTSTLASQSLPAVGRALGMSLGRILPAAVSAPSSLAEKEDGATSSASSSSSPPLVFPAKSVSFVTLGDGSTSNAHFLSALNLAHYAKHRSFHCPVVFGISDNQISISLRNYGYLEDMLSRSSINVYECDGNSIDDVYHATSSAVEYSRRTNKPSIVVYKNIVRRFGHAATDRQAAYLSQSEILAAEEHDVVQFIAADAVAAGACDYEELLERYDAIESEVLNGFELASAEPKVDTRKDIFTHLSAPLWSNSSPSSPSSSTSSVLSNGNNQNSNNNNTEKNEKKSSKKSKGVVMRKNMTAVIDETLTNFSNSIYLGEDIQHGGYYLVTEELAAKFPNRIHDFPPDESSLIGAGIGFAQCGLLPIVEIPYAKVSWLIISMSAAEQLASILSLHSRLDSIIATTLYPVWRYLLSSFVLIFIANSQPFILSSLLYFASCSVHTFLFSLYHLPFKYLDCGADMYKEAALMSWLSGGKQRNGMIFRLQGFDRGKFGGISFPLFLSLSFFLSLSLSLSPIAILF
jgi:hypothetical protein